MPVYVSTGFVGITQPLTHGRLCWDASVGTVTATTGAAGFPAINASTVRTDSAWRPTGLPGWWTNTFAAPTTISFVAIAKHNLGSLNANVFIEYDAAGGSVAWTAWPGLSNIRPETDDPLIFLLPATSVDGVRVRVSVADGNPTISVIRMGRVQEMPRPFIWTGQPITEGDRIGFENTISNTGNWLGRSRVSDGLQFDLTMQHATETWRQTELAAFKRYANGEDAAFFVAARPAGYPNEVAYAWATEVVTASREIPNRNVSTAVTLRCQGLRPANG